MNIPEGLYGFQNIVDYISREHQRKKEEMIGLSNLLAFSKAQNIDEIKHWVDEMRKQATQGMAQYFLSNLGTFEIDEEVLGELGVEDIYFSYPGIKPPTVGISVSTFNGVMNLNTGYYSGADTSKMERFMDSMAHYLASGKPLD